jgi:hypothetical protein
MTDSVKANWSGESAFNLEMAQGEARHWIEAVIGQPFPSNDFQSSLSNGKFLCLLINQIKPGSVKKINTSATPYAQMENIQFFTDAAKRLGLKETQTFTSKELFEKGGRIRDVVITLYWLGRAARGVPSYKGPQLDLSVFHTAKMKCSKCRQAIEGKDYLATMDQQFHPKCASCCKCKKGLDPTQPFYQSGSDIYCHECMVAATQGPSHVDWQQDPGHGHKHGHEHKKGLKQPANTSCGHVNISSSIIYRSATRTSKEWTTSLVLTIKNTAWTARVTLVIIP